MCAYIYIYSIHVWEIQRSEKHQTHSHSHVPHRLATSIASAEPQKHSRLSPLPVTSHPRGIWGPQPFPFPTSWRYHVCSFQCWWCNDLWSWRVSWWRRWWWKRNLKVGKSCQYAAEGDINFEISLTLRNEFGATFTLWKPCVNFEKKCFHELFAFPIFKLFYFEGLKFIYIVQISSEHLESFPLWTKASFGPNLMALCWHHLTSIPKYHLISKKFHYTSPPPKIMFTFFD